MEASSSEKVEHLNDHGTLIPEDQKLEEESLEYGSQGLIAAGPQEVNQSGLPARSSSLSSDASSANSSLLTRNLLSLLERPNFLESPFPRWTSPPQWLQFQLLRNDDEGLIFDENVNQQAEAQMFENEPSEEQIPSRIEQNLQNLLQNQSDFNAPQQTRPSVQWQVPGPTMQSSYQEATIGSFGFPIRPPASVKEDYAEGLIMAPPRVNDPSSTPSLTCNFGLMQHVGYGERKLEFFPEVFGAVDAPFFANRLRSQASNTADLLFLIITDWQPWFERALREALPDFPMQTLLQFSSPQAASMLPSIDYNEGELTCIMEHINTRRKEHEKHENEREIDVGQTKAHCLPLVVWTRARGAIDSCPERPLVVIVSKRTEGISTKIMNHFTNDSYKRWDRLCKNQAWVYLDLYFLFTKWDRVWGAVKHNLQKRTEQVHTRRNVLPIIQQTRQLHKDNNMMISLREHVRIHKASLRIVMQRVEGMLGGVDWIATQALKGRLEDAYQLLEYYDVTATTLLEQQQNLLSLAFNLETVAQGQAVARLNALAFVFLPLSFVASVFGITTFTAPPKWYPVAAAAVLVSTVIIAYSAHQFFTSHALKESAEYPSLPVASPDPEQDSSEPKPTTSWTNLSKVFRRKQSPSKRYPTPGTINNDSPNINDPSRILRRSTDRSLAARAYAPPRSTVQFLPGAYEAVAIGASYSTQYPSQQTYPTAAPGIGAYDFATGISSYDTYSPQRPPQHSIYDSAQYPPNDIPYGQYDYNFGPHNQPQIMPEIDSSQVYHPYIPQSPESSPSPVRIQSPSPGPPIPPRVELDLDESVADQPETLEIRKAVALFDFNLGNENAFHFNKGDVITVISRSDASNGWWLGRIGTSTGSFPANRVEIIEPPPTPTIDFMPQAGVGYIPDDWGLPPGQNQMPYTPASIVPVSEDIVEADETPIRIRRLETIPESPASSDNS